MYDTVFWLYLANGVFLIVHEIDSAYWQEWQLFRLPGPRFFLIVHFPLVFLVLAGLIPVYRQLDIGLVFSLIVGLAGLLAVAVHGYFLARSREEFRDPVSLFTLAGILLISLPQAGITLYLMIV